MASEVVLRACDGNWFAFEPQKLLAERHGGCVEIPFIQQRRLLALQIQKGELASCSVVTYKVLAQDSGDWVEYKSLPFAPLQASQAHHRCRFRAPLLEAGEDVVGQLRCGNSIQH